MEFPVMSIMIICTTLILVCSPSGSLAKTASSPPAPIILTPAPAPAPHYVNLTDLLTVAGPFHTFLNYLISTKVIDTFQNQANNTDEGITIFVPKDSAFSSLKTPSLSNLTNEQIKSICLFHALPHFYSLADFKNLSESGPAVTFAGGGYTLNITSVFGTVHLSSGWAKTKISSSVLSTDPIGVYEVDKVLLPEAIFGTDIPPTAAPAPAPVSEVAPAADSPVGEEHGSSSLPKSTKKSSALSDRVLGLGAWTWLILAILL
ncbi:fasciclin-like arabinogalactan protein 7 isoform X2 [Impatiens glandulifera]|nr:fasciclin-like arabinogalactan protein 7 isoform X2 [Impatiens glandulifera]